MSSGSVTPNIGMRIIPIGSKGWGQSVNNNTSLTDQAFGALMNAYKGEWSNVTVYASGQFVLYEGSVYISTVNANVGQIPEDNPASWVVLTGAQGPPLMFSGDWSSGTTYSVGAFVAYSDGSSYVSIQDANVGHEPDTSPSWWTMLVAAGTPGPPGIASLLALAAIYSRQPVGANIFNSATASIHEYIDTFGNIQGPNDNSTASDFFPVQTGGYFTVKFALAALGGNNTYSFYDEDFVYISGSTSAVADGSSVAVPDTAAFARICIVPSTLNTQVVANGSSLPSDGAYRSFAVTTEAQTAVVAAQASSAATAAAAASASASAAALQANVVPPAVVASVLPSYFNYFDKSRATLDTILSTNDGTTLSLTGWYASPAIAVVPGAMYTMAKGTPGGSGSYGLCWYGPNGTFISGVVLTSTPSDQTVLTAPAGAVSVRFSGQIPTINAQMWTAGNYTGIYVAFAPALGADPTNLAREAAAIQSIVEGYLPEQINLFDKNAATIGQIISTTDGTLSANASWYTSAFIPVKQGVTYVMSQGTFTFGGAPQGFAWYAADKTFFAPGPAIPYTIGQTVTAPAGAAYCRFSNIISYYPNGNADDFCNILNMMFLEGTTFPVTPIEHILNRTFGNLAGIRVGIFGDSITGAFNQGWQQTFFRLTGAIYQYQNARGGRKFSQAFEFYPDGVFDGGTASGFTGPTGYGGPEKLMSGQVKYGTGTVGNTIAQDIANCDLIICGLGTNDGSTTLGAYGDSPSTASLYGYIANFCTTVHNANPRARIIFWTPYQSVTYLTVSQTKAIVLAIQQVAADWGDAVLDMRSTSGIGTYNASIYLPSDGLHPGYPDGFARVGECISQFALQWYAK